MVSALGCHSDVVRICLLQQCKQLSSLKKFSIWYPQTQCWGCMNHFFYCCMDLVFECAIFGLMAHSGIHFLHGIVEFIDGKPKSVSMHLHCLKRIFDCNINIENYTCDKECWNSNNGVYLTNHDIIEYLYQSEFEPALEQAKLNDFANGNGRKWSDPSYVKQKKRDIAKQVGSFVLNDPINKWEYNLCTEYFHAFNNLMHIQVTVNIVDFHCVHLWHTDDTVGVTTELS